jgi:hypothetical protein
VLGSTTGVAPAAGVIGEVISTVKTSSDVTGPSSGAAYVDITSTVSVEPGVYLMLYYVTLSGKASTVDIVLTACVRDNSNNIIMNSATSGLVQNADTCTLFAFVPVVVTSTTLYKLSATSNTAYGTSKIWVESLTSGYTDEQRARLSFVRIG